MKIVYTNSHPSDLLADERAGHLVRARHLIDGLTELGHEIAVTEAATGRGARAAAAAYRGPGRFLPDRLRLAARDAVRLVQSARHGVRVAGLVRRHSAEAVIETHNSTSIAGLIGSRLSRRPLVLDDVTPAAEDDAYYRLGLRRTAAVVRRSVLRRAALVVAVSDSIRRHLLDEGLDEADIVLVPNGVRRQTGEASPGAASDIRDIRAEFGIPTAAPVVVYVGSFQPFHEVGLVVRALASGEGPEGLVALLVGDGDERDDVRDLAFELGFGHRVVCPGRLPNDRIQAVLAAADVAILPATAPYMNPMKLYEYAASGLPIVAPDMETVREALGDLTGVRLFRPGDARGAARAIAAACRSGERPAPPTAATWLDRAALLARSIEAHR